MNSQLLNFLKKTYIVWLVAVVIVIFFFTYNTFLVDRSLSNLRFALKKIDNIKNFEDAKKLAKVLDFSLLIEIASKELPAGNIAKLELAKEILGKTEQMSGLEKDAQELAAALYYSLLKEVTQEELEESSIPMLELSKDVLSKPESFSQLDDVKFALKEVIQIKEQKRPVILVALDKISQLFPSKVTKIDRLKARKQAEHLKEKLRQTKDKSGLQNTYYELANIYTQLSEFILAKESYQQAVELEPESSLAKKSRFNIAWNEKLIGNYDEAIKGFDSISSAGSSEEIALFSKYQMADVLRKKGEYQKAIDVYDELVRENPNPNISRLAKYAIGFTYLYDVKDYEKAREVLQDLSDSFKGTNMSTHVQKRAIPAVGHQYLIKGFKLLKKGYELGETLNFVDAQGYFDKALEINPGDGLAYVGKALSFFWLRDSERALEFARKAVKLAPNDEVASINLGYIYIQLEMFEDAIAEYKRFVSVFPFISRVYYNLGCAYVLNGQLEEANASFTNAIKIDPEFIFAYNNKGWCLWKLGRYAAATEAFEKALQIKPDFQDAIYNLALIYKKIGRRADSKKKAEKVLEINPIYPGAQNLLRELETQLHL